MVKGFKNRSNVYLVCGWFCQIKIIVSEKHFIKSHIIWTELEDVTDDVPDSSLIYKTYFNYYKNFYF